jgi:signal peptidase I
MILRWFTSRTVRKAIDLRQQVRRLINEQRDIVNAGAIANLERAIDDLNRTLELNPGRSDVERSMANLITVAEQSLKTYPNAAVRENVKEIFSAATVILAFTTFFLQLTKIPTGSMQPTLYGIVSENLRDSSDVKVPGRISRFLGYWIHGISYYQITAKADGSIEKVEAPQLIFPFVKRQRIKAGGHWYTVWFPPERLAERAGLGVGQELRKGEDIIRLKVVSGDHLLMDRLTYNFRRPRRGEIIVFKTKGISELPQGQLYIKRLVALGGERVRIGNDQHLVINGQRLDAATPRFENVYTFNPTRPEHNYFGHVNQHVASRMVIGSIAHFFKTESDEYFVKPHHYLAMGDNTMNSYDSRQWGAFSDRNVIGKCWFVYWPFTDRFGWGNR